MNDQGKFIFAVIVAFLIGMVIGMFWTDEFYKDEIKQLEKQKLELEIKKLKNQLNNL